MKVVFTRTPKPKRFNYPPRYYDAEKEHWEQRKRELNKTSDPSDFGRKLKRNWTRFKKNDDARKKKAGRAVLIYLAIAAALLYFVFFS